MDYVKKYIDSFGDPNSDSGRYPKDSRLAKAYEVALDIRKFEIELYWKRSASIWLLVGGIAAALGLLLSGKGDSSNGAVLSERGKEIACFFLCLSGATICYAWRLVNEGSKFWQRNWEYQVGILEQKVLGPLYKTVMSSEKSKIMYSVSKINGSISLYLSCLFLTAALIFFIGKDGQLLMHGLVKNCLTPGLLEFFVKILVLSAHVWFIFKLRGSGQSREKTKNFDSDIEVSLRQIIIKKEPYGTSEATHIWDVPLQIPEVTSKWKSALKNIVSFFDKSDKPS